MYASAIAPQPVDRMPYIAVVNCLAAMPSTPLALAVRLLSSAIDSRLVATQREGAYHAAHLVHRD